MIGKNRKTFSINFKADDGETYEGKFTTKRLSIKDRAQIGVKKSQLTGGQYCVRDVDGNPTGQGIDEDTDVLNGMIAHLSICLEQKPSWFNLDEIADMALVQHVYQEVMDFEVSFFRAKDGSDSEQPGQVGQGDSGAEPQGPGSGNTPKKVVDKEVQAALDA